MLLHHTLGNGDFSVFVNAYRTFTVAQANLHDPKTAAAEIDATLRKCWIQRRPVYIELPTDMVLKEINATPLATPIDLSYPLNDPEEERVAVQTVLDRLYKAKRPVCLVDGCVTRHLLVSEVDDFVRKSGLPTFVTPMGKGAVNETLPNFGGVYAGAGSLDTVRQLFESSDLILGIGTIKSDFNTTGFTYSVPTLDFIDMHSPFITIGYARYGVHMRGVIQRLTAAISPQDLHITPLSLPAANSAQPSSSSIITHDYLWAALSSWLRPTDILVTETGTSYLGVWATKFPRDITAISQTLWSSIGYALPAAQGAAVTAHHVP
jgi:pyruvate decarboxylase